MCFLFYIHFQWSLLWRNFVWDSFNFGAIMKDYYTKNYNNSSIPLLYFSIFLSYCTLKDDFFHFPAFITQLSKVELYAARAAELEMELCHQFVCKWSKIDGEAPTARPRPAPPVQPLEFNDRCSFVCWVLFYRPLILPCPSLFLFLIRYKVAFWLLLTSAVTCDNQ